MTKQTKNFWKRTLQKHQGKIQGILLVGYSLGSTLKWIALWEYDGFPFRASKLLKLDGIFIFFQNTTCSNVQTKTSSKLKAQSSLSTFFRRKQDRKSNTTPTTPVVALIKKTRKIQESWNKKLNFQIPGHLICVFCCYRSPTVVIINIITVYKNHEYTRSFVHCTTADHVSI